MKEKLTFKQFLFMGFCGGLVLFFAGWIFENIHIGLFFFLLFFIGNCLFGILIIINQNAEMKNKKMQEVKR